MDPVILARIQFAFTVGFHILWPTFTIGLASFVALLSGLWWHTGHTVYRDLMHFWIRIFAPAFGVGAMTGLFLSYEIGTNWAGFSRSVANVLGPLFMYEALTAFFLEAGFIGIMLFGERRVGKRLHFFSCCMVAGGTLLSANWILASNSWMQTPAGAIADADGIFHVLGFAGLVISIWPYVVPRQVTVWDGVSDPQTLAFACTGAALIIPIVLAYQAYAYWAFRGKTVREPTAPY